jgi:hypothetical protein
MCYYVTFVMNLVDVMDLLWIMMDCDEFVVDCDGFVVSL